MENPLEAANDMDMKFVPDRQAAASIAGSFMAGEAEEKLLWPAESERRPPKVGRATSWDPNATKMLSELHRRLTKNDIFRGGLSSAPLGTVEEASDDLNGARPPRPSRVAFTLCVPAGRGDKLGIRISEMEETQMTYISALPQGNGESRARRAGLVPGDVLIGVNYKPALGGMKAVEDIMRRASAGGRAIYLQVSRDVDAIVANVAEVGKYTKVVETFVPREPIHTNASEALHGAFQISQKEILNPAQLRQVVSALLMRLRQAEGWLTDHPHVPLMEDVPRLLRVALLVSPWKPGSAHPREEPLSLFDPQGASQAREMGIPADRELQALTLAAHGLRPALQVHCVGTREVPGVLSPAMQDLNRLGPSMIPKPSTLMFGLRVEDVATGTSWNVERAFEDIETMRDSLLASCPSLSAVPFPSRGFRLSSTIESITGAAVNSNSRPHGLRARALEAFFREATVQLCAELFVDKGVVKALRLLQQFLGLGFSHAEVEACIQGLENIGTPPRPRAHNRRSSAPAMLQHRRDTPYVAEVNAWDLQAETEKGFPLNRIGTRRRIECLLFHLLSSPGLLRDTANHLLRGIDNLRTKYTPQRKLIGGRSFLSGAVDVDTMNAEGRIAVINKCNELLEEVSRRICALQEVVMDEYGELLRTCVCAYANAYGSYGSRLLKADHLKSEEEYTFVSPPPDDVMRELLLKRAVRRQVEASIFLGVRRQLMQDGSDILFPCLQQMQGFMLLLASEQMALQARTGINVHFKDPSRFTPGEEHFDPGVMVRAGNSVKPLFGIDPRVRGCKAFKEALQSWKDLQTTVLPSDLARGLIGCARQVVSLYQAYLKIISPEQTDSPMPSPITSPFSSPMQSPSSRPPETPPASSEGTLTKRVSMSAPPTMNFGVSPATKADLFNENELGRTLSFEDERSILNSQSKDANSTEASTPDDKYVIDTKQASTPDRKNATASTTAECKDVSGALPMLSPDGAEMPNGSTISPPDGKEVRSIQVELMPSATEDNGAGAVNGVDTFAGTKDKYSNLFGVGDAMEKPLLQSPTMTVAEQLFAEGPFRNVQLSASRARILQRHIEYHRSGRSLAGVLDMANADNLAVEAPSFGVGLAAMSADEFLPLFAYVLVHARPRRLLLMQLLIPALLDPDDAVGERGYHCATLQAGVQLVLQLWDERLEQENARERRELRRRRSSFDFEMPGP